MACKAPSADVRMSRHGGHAGDNFCPECQASFDAQPLGALVRRWSAEAADVDGRQLGLVCDRCKVLVRKHNARAALGGLQFHFENPNRASARAPASPVGATALFGLLPKDEQATRRGAHEREMRERLGWCLQRGLAPAHEHVHLAPGCDANFMVCQRACACACACARVRANSTARQFGEPPWRADGAVNERGVPFCRAEELQLAKERQLEDYDARGFSCRRCGSMVRVTPREFQGAVEPVDWWWCTECKAAGAASAAGKTLKEKRAAQAAQGCMRLDTAWGVRS